MKILIAEPAAPRGMFEVCLEIAERHILAGDEVYVLDDLKVPFMRGSFGEAPEPHRLILDTYRRNKGFSLLTKPGIKQVKASLPLNMFSSYEDMVSHCEIAELIHAINNTLVSQDKSVSAFTRRFDRVGQLLSDGLNIFTATRAILLEKAIDRVYVHNGRASAYYAVVMAAKSLNVSFAIYEWANHKDKYFLVHDQLIHDLSYWQSYMEEVCGLVSDDEIIEEGTKYFNAKKRFEKSVPGTFLDADTVHLAPAEYFSASKRVIYFSTSEFEYIGLKDGPFADQVLMVREIAQGLKKHKVPLFVRVHPHMRGSYDNKLWEALDNDSNVYLISSESNMNSYELVKHADCVVTSGSSISVEAAFAGKKVVVLGPALEEHLGCCLHPQSMREAIEMIENDELLPPINASFGACRYAYFLMNYGEPYRFASALRRGHTIFKGQNLPYWRVPRFLEPLRPLRDGIQRTIKRIKPIISLRGGKPPEDFPKRWP